MWKMRGAVNVIGHLAEATISQRTDRRTEGCRYRLIDNTCTWVVSLKFRPPYAPWKSSQYPLVRSPC